MATKTRLNITSGLPFKKVILVTLPTDRDWWTDLSDFELLFQIREEADVLSALVLDMAEYLTPVFSNENQVLVTFDMSGSETRLLLKSGYYDVIMSDTGTGDERAYPILQGFVKRKVLVTAPEVFEVVVIP